MAGEERRGCVMSGTLYVTVSAPRTAWRLDRYSTSEHTGAVYWEEEHLPPVSLVQCRVVSHIWSHRNKPHLITQFTHHFLLRHDQANILGGSGGKNLMLGHIDPHLPSPTSHLLCILYVPTCTVHTVLHGTFIIYPETQKSASTPMLKYYCLAPPFLCVSLFVVIKLKRPLFKYMWNMYTTSCPLRDRATR